MSNLSYYQWDKSWNVLPLAQDMISSPLLDLDRAITPRILKPLPDRRATNRPYSILGSYWPIDHQTYTVRIIYQIRKERLMQSNKVLAVWFISHKELKTKNGDIQSIQVDAFHDLSWLDEVRVHYNAGTPVKNIKLLGYSGLDCTSYKVNRSVGIKKGKQRMDINRAAEIIFFLL